KRIAGRDAEGERILVELRLCRPGGARGKWCERGHGRDAGGRDEERPPVDQRRAPTVGGEGASVTRKRSPRERGTGARRADGRRRVGSAAPCASRSRRRGPCAAR